MGLSILRFELWAHPVRCGPGRDRYGMLTCAMQHRCCAAISRIRDMLGSWAAGGGEPGGFDLVLDRAWQPVGLHLGPHLRHVMPEHDDVVLLAGDVPDVVA